MFDLIFDLSPIAQLLVLCVLMAVTLAVSFAWLGLLHRRFQTTPKLLPVGPAFTPVATVFALLLSFLAVDIWTQQRQASDAALRESTAFQRLGGLALSDALNAPQGLPALARYRTAVLQDEWDSNSNRTPSPVAAGALRELGLLGARLGREGAPGPLVSEWLRAVHELEDARQRRLLLGADHTDDNQWAVVLMLALFTHLVIAAAHLDKPPAGRLILALFSLATTLALCRLAMHANPDNGIVDRVHLPATASSPAAPAG